MGETEEKVEGAAAEPQTTEAEEPKETDSMLKKEEDQSKEEVKKSKENLVDDTKKDAEPKKEEVINIPDSEEKKDDEKEKPSKEEEAAVEGKEVKPKKVPFGGLKLPGFFTRNKKPAAEEGDGAEGELLAKTDDVEKGVAGEEETPAEEEAPAANESRFNRNLLGWFKNPFAKKDSAAAEPEETPPAEGEKAETTEEAAKEDAPEADKAATEDAPKEGEEEAKPVEESAPAAEKKSVLSNIRLPHISLSNLIPRRLRPGNRASEDLEMGSGPKTKAGLASMETLDDSLKDTDSKDQTDKAVNGKMADEDMETVKLDEKEEKPKDKAAEAAEDQKPKPILDRIREYQCSVGEYRKKRYFFGTLPRGFSNYELIKSFPYLSLSSR